MNTSNPAFTKEAFAGYEQVFGSTRPLAMTVQGTVAKTFGLLGILSATALWSWNAMLNRQIDFMVLPVSAIAASVLAIITIMKPTVSPWTAPVYAAFEGVCLGMLSNVIEHSFRGYPGIAIQAVSMTCGTLFVMLFLYGARVIKVTQKLRTGIVAATGALCLVYLISIVLSLFGKQVPFLYSSSPLGIGISVFVVGLAAFNLLLDFDFIEYGARVEAPRYMEWYAAFGLILTLVWLYLEILRLLQKLQDRR